MVEDEGAAGEAVVELVGEAAIVEQDREKKGDLSLRKALIP
jgi:hypothetical protein